MAGDALDVLMVEDSRGDAALIQNMLRRARGAQFRVEHVERLGDGLVRLGQHATDVVLLDFCLPDCRGLETYRRVREAAPAVPVIILTNQDDETMAVSAVREGAQDYLLKREVDANLLERGIRYAIERKAAEEALRESEQRYALAVRGASVGLWDWNLLTGAVYYSPRWKAIARCAEAELRPTIDAWLQRVHPSDVEGLRLALDKHLNGDTAQFEYEHRLCTPSGDVVWVLTRGVAVRDEGRSGRAVRMAGSLMDVCARKEAEVRLVRDALHDALTGLPNRNLLRDRLRMAAVRAGGRAGKPFAVLFVDMDRFKNVNDSLGHTIGDELLRAIAVRLSACLRSGDTLARIGGDEFAVLLHDVEAVEDALHAARRIQEALAERFVIDGHEIYTSASIGCAVSSPGLDRGEDLLRDADIAMYRAKRSGPGNCLLFDQRMHQRALALLNLETQLRRAIDREEFVLHYQPIVSLDTGALVAFEALIRWQHPDGRLVSPMEFIPLAEETGLCVPIGWWTLREACRQLRAWHACPGALPHLGMSVNMSGRMFAQTDMVPRTQAVLAETGLDPACLRLEITESTTLDHGEAVLARLTGLRDLGVQLHLDDFGTGYSSLSYLRRFRYDTLKIDRSFVWGLGDDPDARVIVSAVLAIGRHLGIEVIAEGIETADQLRRLRELGCPLGQGYYFARPLPAAAAADLLTERLKSCA